MEKKMKKISKRQIRKISFRCHVIDTDMSQEDVIQQMKEIAKKDDGIIKKFKEYGVSLKEIDNVKVIFCSLDVSAKTMEEDGEIVIKMNEEMLDSKKINHPESYLIHELLHMAARKAGFVSNKKDKQYLDLPTEVESFKAQIDYLKDCSEEEAEEYTDNLLSYHGLRGKKRQEKKKELLGE